MLEILEEVRNTLSNIEKGKVSYVRLGGDGHVSPSRIPSLIAVEALLQYIKQLEGQLKDLGCCV